MTVWDILLIIILIGLNAFFVSIEFAVVATRRSKFELIANTKSHSGAIVKKWLENTSSRDRLIAASQLGITLVSLALGAVGENAFERLLEPLFHDPHMPAWLSTFEFIIPVLPLALSLIIVTAMHVVLGEQVPKVAVLRDPEAFAIKAAPLMNAFTVTFSWFISLLDKATHLILMLIGLPSSDNLHAAYSVEEIRQMVTGPDVEGIFEEPEREMLSAVIDFGEMVVRQLAIPRTEIIAVSADTSVSDIINTAIIHGVTKIPVYEESLDQILGIIHMRDIMRVMLDGNNPQLQARSLMREALFVPETISVNQLLHQFRSKRMHLAIVLDEYGGTAGLITLEDLLEEIIGDVQDPFENTPPQIQSQPDGTSLIDGMALIEEINEHFGLSLADPDYDTIAGYVLGKLKRIAQPGDIVRDEDSNIQLKVTKMDRLRISQVQLRQLTD